MFYHLDTFEKLPIKYPCLVYNVDHNDWESVNEEHEVKFIEYSFYNGMNWKIDTHFNILMSDMASAFDENINSNISIFLDTPFVDNRAQFAIIFPASYKCDLCGLIVGENNNFLAWKEEHIEGEVCDEARYHGPQCNGKITAV